MMNEDELAAIKKRCEETSRDVEDLITEVRRLRPFYNRVCSLAMAHSHLVSDLAWVGDGQDIHTKGPDVVIRKFPPEPKNRDVVEGKQPKAKP